MITKTANDYLLKEAYSLQELKDDASALKDQLVAKAKAGAGYVRRFANDVGRGYKDLYNYAGTKARAAMEVARAKANDLDNFVYDKRQQLSNALSGGRLNDLQKKFDRATDIMDWVNQSPKKHTMGYKQDLPGEEY